MNVIRIEPNKDPEMVDIENTLEALQEAVGGHIETLTVFTDMVIICDEEGRIKGKPYCCSILGCDFVGTVLIAGVDGCDFTNCPVDASEFESYMGR